MRSMLFMVECLVENNVLRVYIYTICAGVTPDVVHTVNHRGRYTFPGMLFIYRCTTKSQTGSVRTDIHMPLPGFNCGCISRLTCTVHNVTIFFVEGLCTFPVEQLYVHNIIIHTNKMTLRVLHVLLFIPKEICYIRTFPCVHYITSLACLVIYVLLYFMLCGQYTQNALQRIRSAVTTWKGVFFCNAPG